jgi:hypothetical protein
MVNNFFKAAAVSAVAIFGAGVASAATISFDDVDGNTSGGNPKTYTSQGFSFTPVNINNDGKCASGSCTKESQQTGLPTMTFGGNAFTLKSFYFSIIGEGTGGANFISVEGFDASGSTGSAITFNLSEALSNFPSSKGVTVSYTKAATGAACSTPTDLPSNVICKNHGYTADLSGLAAFQDVTSIQWSSSATAQGLIDDIMTGGTAVVPLPAAGWMLLAGVGGLAAMRRRKKKS